MIVRVEIGDQHRVETFTGSLRRVNRLLVTRRPWLSPVRREVVRIGLDDVGANTLE